MFVFRVDLSDEDFQGFLVFLVVEGGRKLD